MSLLTQKQQQKYLDRIKVVSNEKDLLELSRSFHFTEENINLAYDSDALELHLNPHLLNLFCDKLLIMFKVRGQVEKCLEPVRLCNYACEIKNDMCQGNLSVNFCKVML